MAQSGPAPDLYRRVLRKPDGRELVLYSREPLDPGDPAAPAPQAGAAGPRASHLRCHPLRGEWVVYAGHRQDRTFLPPPGWDPLAPATDPVHSTEVPAGNWQVAVFENLFSALGSTAAATTGPTTGAITEAPAHLVDTAPCGGRTEVVVFTQDPQGSLGGLPPERIALVVDVWADRTRALGAQGDVAHVFPFENRGVEVGVTLPHPHGQIYPWLRMPDRLKYLAGSELGAGVFTADTLPEAKARELRAVEVP